MAELQSSAAQLSQQLNWLSSRNRARLRTAYVQLLMDHHTRRGTDPAILVSGVVIWLATGGDRSGDPVNQLWYAVDLVANQVKSRYYDLSEVTEH